MMRPDLVLDFLVCVFDPASRTIDTTTCVRVCEIVAHAPECAERFREVKLTLPANLTIGSYPECWRPRRPCGS